MPRSLKYISLLILATFVVVVGFAASQNPSADWLKSKHANRDLAVDEATWENRQATAAHCGRCHSEQGFKAWVPQLLKGDPGLIKKPDGKDADEAFLKGLGLTKDLVQPITCAACHGDGLVLRITNNISMLPAGFGVSAVGKGALCMACHNTRNGRTVWDNADPKRYSQPHEAAQADVIMGKNVFFYNDTGDTASPHAVFTGNACVSCHKELGTEGHLFKPTECAACHGEKIKETFVQTGVAELLKQLAAGIEKKMLAVKDKIACVTSWDPATDKDTPNTALDGKQIKAVEIPPGIHGQISFKFILQDNKAVYSQLGNVKDACGDQGKAVIATADPIVRATWNYLLFEYDGSHGVHNPSFTRNTLLATINAMK
jgi:cytochrome c553